MKKLISLFAMVLLSVCLIAQTPESLSYQAVIRNSAGELVKDKAIGMRVSILRGSPTGGVVSTELFNLSTNSNGLVTAKINVYGINWTPGPLFIKTETDPLGGTNYSITSVNELLSVPFALHAQTAEKAYTTDYSTLTGKPTTLGGYGITNGMSTTHPANEITEVNKQNWNLSHSWGNHASAGYLKSTTLGINANYFNINLVNTINNGLLVYSTPNQQWEVKPITDFTSIFAPTSHTHTELDPYFSQWFSLTGQDDARPYDYMGWNGTKWVRTRNTFAKLDHNHPVTDDMGVVGFMSSMDKHKLDGLTVADGSETKITGNPGITVKGNGTTATPYTIAVTQHTVGEIYGGGIIFYVYDNGQHGLIASTADAMVGNNPNLSWIFNAQPYTAGAGANGIRGGIANTAAMMSYQMRSTYSYPLMNTYSVAVGASLYSALDAQGIRYSDWYVPSASEMVLLVQSNVLSNLSSGTPYWSSTESIDNPNYAQMVYNGVIQQQPKSTTFRVRVIRAF